MQKIIEFIRLGAYLLDFNNLAQPVGKIYPVITDKTVVDDIQIRDKALVGLAIEKIISNSAPLGFGKLLLRFYATVEDSIEECFNFSFCKYLFHSRPGEPLLNYEIGKEDFSNLARRYLFIDRA